MQTKLRLTVDDLHVDTFVLAPEGAEERGTVHGRGITVGCTATTCTATDGPRKCTQDTVCYPEVC